MIKRLYQLNIAPYFSLLLVIIVFGLHACDSSNENTASVKKEEPLVDLNKEFLVFLENYKGSSLLLDFYKTSGKELLWLNNQLELNDRGLQLISYVTHAENFGLSTSFYPKVKNIDSLKGITKDTNPAGWF